MLTFSYTASHFLKNEIEKINATRDKILLRQLPRKEELQLRWETNIDRITQSTRITPQKLKRQEVLDQLDPRKKRLKKNYSRSYLDAIEWVNQNWYLTNDKVPYSAVKKILSVFEEEVRVDEKQVGDALDFVQVNPENPIVASALIFFLIHQILPNNDNNIKISIIVSNIFMYKGGYDFRGLLNLEEFIASDLDHFKDLIARAEKEQNLSAFLEYYTQAVSISAEKALLKISTGQFSNDLPRAFYELTERQKDILSMFSRPGIKISNKTVQKEFGVSQITASRDLAKLHTLGLIFSAGKGRSVYYTKI